MTERKEIDGETYERLCEEARARYAQRKARLAAEPAKSEHVVAVPTCRALDGDQ